MKSRKFLFTTALAGFLSISAMASAEKAISKPAGAKGTGKVSAFQAKSNSFWWPDQLNLQPLRAHSPESNPYGEDFDYAEEFDQLDIDAVKKDIDAVLTDSQDWWPADYGNYGPFFIRMAWHSAGTYRTADGRGGAGGGQQRFEPLNSWPDNGNLDKARRLLWPVKQKYGRQLSWADLMVLAGNVAMENMGFKTLGFAGGRADDWEPDIVYWGPEVEMLASDRENKDGKLQRPLGATHMGLIYVNPEGPKGIPDAEKSAHNIRTAFGRMAMNDEETVALVAGGHTFGKMHGAGKASKYVGAEPAAAPVEEQGFGWKNSLGKGHSEDTITSGIEGAWTSAPVQWTHMYLQNLMNNDWEQTKGPGGGIHWEPKDKESNLTVPDAHIEDKYHVPVMTTADMALKVDPEYHKISKRFLDNPEEFEKAFASAWFKLTHRDMGPRARYIGKYVPSDVFSWQDPVPKAGHVISVGEADVLKKRILSSGLTIPELVRVAWAAGSSFRDTDLRGGANGARIALAPQKDWEVNNPEEAAKVVAKLKEVQDNFGKNVPLADLIVLGGAAAIEKAAKDAGYYNLKVPFKAGRGDATQAQTDVKSFAELEPKADGFRNYYTDESLRSPAEALVDKADTLGLTVPEMTVLVGGLRSLDANYQGSKNGVFTDKPGALSNDFFVNLLDMSTKWEKSGTEGIYNGVDRKTGEKKYTATPVDLAFGSNSELRAVAEVYAASDAKDKFAKDFVAAWVKVMNADRF